MEEDALREIEGQKIKSKLFSKEDLIDQAFRDCIFTSCDFSAASLRNVMFCTCSFVNCNFSLVKLAGTRFQDVKFVNCKIVGAEFSKCEKTFFSATFKDCSLQYCNFSDLNMKNVSFNGSRLTESTFKNTCLKGADFSDVNLLGTLFHNCDLNKADFSQARQYAIDPHTNKIKNAIFSMPEVVGLLRGFDITIV